MAWGGALFSLAVLLLAAQGLHLSPRPVRSLLIDNYDSYTYNLWQLLAEVNGAEPRVVYNDRYASWASLLAGEGGESAFDNIILSPGPGNPTNPADFGVCMEAIRQSRVPLLGVCLGHQGMAHAFGSRVGRAPEPMHGRLSPLTHTADGIFANIPQGARVVRYHSLLAHDVHMAQELRETAWIESDTPGAPRLTMALQHRTRPLYGVQFHPESVATDCGRALLTNFRDITLQHYQQQEQQQQPAFSVRAEAAPVRPPSSPAAPAPAAPAALAAAAPARPHVVVLEAALPQGANPAALSERIFESIYGPHAAAFWLDSAFHNRQGELAGPDGHVAHAPLLSFMGALDGDGAFAAEYIGDNEMVVRRQSGAELRGENVFEFLSRHTEAREEELPVLHHLPPLGEEADHEAQGERRALPFDTSGALFGFLGYEARHEAGHILTRGQAQAEAGRYNLSSTRDGSFRGSRFGPSGGHPGALYLSPTRYLVIDHDAARVYVASHGPNEEEAKARAEELRRLVAAAVAAPSAHASAQHTPSPFLEAAAGPSSASLLRGGPSWRDYRSTIDRCLEHIRLGETYEVCLTQMFHGHLPQEHSRLELYKTLRRRNPAPFACYFRYDPVRHFGLAGASRATGAAPGQEPAWYKPGGLAICCSSPERFLSLRGRSLESKPIKGTARRDLASPEGDARAARRLAEDEKSQAENLMIVDLVRNDVGRVSAVGSVSAPGLMKVETFASVHHLVSTVRGTLRPGLGLVDALVATFPGGSMTGAPKLRTMDIIDTLEGRGRGVYSGAIGYLTRSGQADLNIAIRTAVVAGEALTVSSGGAIIALSDPQAEVDETRLKAQAVSNAIGFALAEEDPSSHAAANTTPITTAATANVRANAISSQTQ